MPLADMTVSIIGLGAIGGSVAKALKNNEVGCVNGVDISWRALDYAKNHKLIDKGFKDPKEALLESDLVFMCIYPEDMIEFIRNNHRHFKKNAIITDCAGIKTRIIDEVHKMLRPDLEFIGGHPLADYDTIGIEGSSEAVFQDSNYIITPTAENSEVGVNLLKEVVRSMGFRKIVSVTPEKHDEIVAFTSHLPHVLAMTLLSSSSRVTKSFEGDNFKEMSKPNSINTDLWSELLIDNKENVVREITKLQMSLETIKRTINQEDKKGMQVFFEEAKLKMS